MKITHPDEVYVAAVEVARFGSIKGVTILFGPFKDQNEVHRFAEIYGLIATYRRMIMVGKTHVKWAPDREVPLLRMPKTRKARTEYLVKNLPALVVQLTAGKPQVEGKPALIATIKLILRRVFVDIDVTDWQISYAVVKHPASTSVIPAPTR